jgi:Xaa-Pro aminopeptidase
MFKTETYIARRKQLKEKVSGIILLQGNDQSSMNYADNWFPFRQDSSFLYFIGLDQPNLVVVIDVDNDKEILFANEASVDDLIWNGRQPSLAEQAFAAGITAVKPLKELENYLATHRAKGPVHFLPPYRPEHAQKLHRWLNIPFANLKNATSVPLIKAIVSLRSIKQAEEIVEIDKAVNISAAMHLAAMKSAREGMTEAEVAGIIQSVAIAGGGNLAFPTILTTHGEILHNHYGNHRLPKDRMVLCDCGAETAMHYAGDLTRTFPVNDEFSSLQKEMYEIVLAAQQTAAMALKPGELFLNVHLLACEKLTEGLKALGLMKGDAKEAVAAGAHTLFFQCGLGHMMGLDVHDMENLGEEYVGYTEDLKKSTEFGLKSLRLGRALEPGFVFTVEPGLYFIPELMDRWKAENKHTAFIIYDKLEHFRDFGGIRIEEDFLITQAASRLLGNELVKTAEDVEAIRSKAATKKAYQEIS